MEITQQPNYNYGKQVNYLKNKNNTANYATLNFRSGKELVKDTVQTTIKQGCTSEKMVKILTALGLSALAAKIISKPVEKEVQTVKPFVKEIQLIQTNINNKYHDIEKRNNMGTYFYSNTKYKNDMQLYRDQLNTILKLEQEYLNNFKKDIIPEKNKKHFTEEEGSIKLTELQVNISRLDNEYNRLDSELKKIENGRYDELVNKELEIRGLVDQYKVLDKENMQLKNQKFDDKELKNKLDDVNARIENINAELNTLKSEYSPLKLKVEDLQQKNEKIIKRLRLQDTSNPIIAEEREKFCKENSDAINEILKDGKMETLRKDIDAKEKELEESKCEKIQIENELYERRKSYEKDIRIKTNELDKKMASIRNVVENKLGFYMYDYPYYNNVKVTTNHYNIPEWITTTNGERPFNVINDTFRILKSESVQEDMNGYMQTRVFYDEYGGKSLG